MIIYLLFALIGYLSGSILFALYVPKLLFNKDIVALSKDNNPGTANAVKICGIPTGMVCLICEIAKGFLPVSAALLYVNTDTILFALVMAAPVVGHIFPVFNKCRGGKGIAVSFGVLFGLIPHSYMAIALAAIYIFFSLVLVVRPHSSRSVCTFVCFAFTSLLFGESLSIILGCFTMSALVSYRHLVKNSKGGSELSVFGKIPIKILNNIK